MLATLVPAVYDGPRAAAADFFVRARTAHSLTGLPPFADGDCATAPGGYLWLRNHGRWAIPGHADGLSLTDDTVTSWWRRRPRTGSRFALVHRLRPNELHRITASRYDSRFHGESTTWGEFAYEEQITGDRLRAWAAQTVPCRTLSVHLELPSGIVTLHSTLLGDVYCHPGEPAPGDHS
ncbi:hypothetical protein AB0M39_39680 [Streptomyces sp. NPDC051907]|uniref:hypothetical protein n=1 Tax=Streptomyces sp. NPDC051907 TaxID=3155284 RepID=UPI00343A95BD